MVNESTAGSSVRFEPQNGRDHVSSVNRISLVTASDNLSPSLSLSTSVRTMPPTWIYVDLPFYPISAPRSDHPACHAQAVW